MSKCKVGPRDKITGLCPKAKPKKLIKLKKICNDDQEINPKTGRCINKCKENEERHPVLKICIAKCKNGKNKLLPFSMFCIHFLHYVFIKP